MLDATTLRVAETEPQESRTEPEGFESRYDTASEDFELRDYADTYSFPVFVTAVLEKLGKKYTHADARLVDAIEEPEDVHFGILLVYPDESLMFIGSDPTAKDSIPWFAFTIERSEPMPAPDTAQDALDLLKPRQIQDVEHEDSWLPNRHGEWWLLPCNLVPAGTVFTPGVASRPYGPSPLGNHVPREYAFTVSDDEFMASFHDAADAPSSIVTPPEALEWTYRQLQKSPVPEGVPNWARIREFAGDVIVRGTVRHRDDDHYVEQLGEVWHQSLTHNVEVYTGDGVAEDVHLDYHGV